MAFGNLVITEAGRELLSSTQIGESITIVGIAIGDGTCTESFQKKTELTNLLFITEADVTLKRMACIITSDIPEREIEYYFREIGVFVKDKKNNQILYAYDNAGEEAELIYNSPSIVKERRIKLILELEETQKITIQSNSTLYATQKDLEKVKRKLDSIYNIPKEEVNNIMEGIAAEEEEDSFFEDKEYEEEIGEPITTREIDNILNS